MASGCGGILSALGAGALYEGFDAPVCFLISALIPGDNPLCTSH